MIKQYNLDDSLNLKTFQILYEKYKDAIKIIKNLKKENEQLKSDNKSYVKRYGELFDEYIKLKEENKKLKMLMR